MEIDITLDTTIQQLVEDNRNNNLRPNLEYQRGLVWKLLQKQMFIDSLFRGYKAPAFYFHEVQTRGRKQYANSYIIDGQQRIDAITSYMDGKFRLLDPDTDRNFKFPNFVKGKDCPWGGKRFDDLSDDLKQQLLNETVVVYEITTDEPNEIRDLFIRLQAGTPLNPQDKRDAWPGGLTEFVLTVGGKKDQHDGWPLFNESVKISSESKRRQLAAQAFMLYWHKINKKGFVDIKSRNLDEFYHEQIDFSLDSDEAKNFKEICDRLNQEFTGLPKLVGHHLLHLVLLVSDLQNYFVLNSWNGKLGKALNTFKNRCEEAIEANAKGQKGHEFSEYYSEYAQWTPRNSDLGPTIEGRHVLFYEKMIELLRAVRKDPVRGFTEADREHIFHRDVRQCQYREMQRDNDPESWTDALMVDWKYAHIHHVIPHSEGGETVLANGVLVHKDNHRHLHSNAQAVEAFREWWQNRKTNSPQRADKGSKSRRGLSTELPPDGTKLRAKYKSEEYHGIIRDRKIELSGKVFNSLSAAGKSITKRKSGWDIFDIRLPESDEWIRAHKWRVQNSR